MNSYPDYIAFFENVAARLTLLGKESGKTNLFFVESPEEAETLINKMKVSLALPCLLVEYYDEGTDSTNGDFKEITGAFVVLAQAEKQQKGVDTTREVIYEKTKPAADQIYAHMQRLSDGMQFKIAGKSTILLPGSSGNWVGPLHNNLYGWRQEFTWRVAAKSCYNSAFWLS